MNREKNTLLFFLLFPLFIYSQNLDKIGKSSLFKVTGGVGVNTIYYNGNSNREPFTYFLSGNVNLNISDVYNIPVSFSYSNSKFQANTPFTFNRLSLHPSYKWVTAHIGDINMSFSPYTLNGHQFTGVGFDLSPKDKLKISLMYGRFLKEREFNEENLNGEANYKRIGYGIKASYKFDKLTAGVIFFRAKDDTESLNNPIPIEKEVLPKDNTVISFNTELNFLKDLKFKGEVALSALTEDIRVEGESNHFASFLLSSNPTTQYYKAYNLNLVYKVGRGAVGLGYELIDPNYRTLGGYFFNNDLENLTVNASQTIFKDKLSINLNAGLQNDDIDNKKATQLSRLVSSLNLGYIASEKLNINVGYSNFQSFTNIKNQFDFINGVSQIEEELDQDNISQVSQNANVNVNYILKETPSIRQNLNLSLSFQDAVNKIGDKVREEDASSFYNLTGAYTVGYPDSDLIVSGAINASYSELGISEENLIFGPTLSVSKGFLEKKLKFNSSLSYNESIHNGNREGQVTNLRVGGRYVYRKRHNFNLNGLFQLRNSTNISNKSITMTFGYTYNFGIFNSKDLKFKRREKTKKEKKEKKVKKPIRFVYKDSLYEGTISEISSRVNILLESKNFKNIPKEIKKRFQEERIKIAKEKNNRVYKIKVIQLLDDIYKSKEYLKDYNELIYQALTDVYKSAIYLDYPTEQDYLKNKKEIRKHILWYKTPKERASYPKDVQAEFNKMNQVLRRSHKKLLVHRWIVSKIEEYKTFKMVEEDSNVLKEFRESNAPKVYKMFKMNEKKKKIKLYLQGFVIEFFAKESEKHIDESQYELKYTD
ncbi:TonB-dependent receptor [Tenacibaculum caenipelagi]|uniref:Uncharacterized protein n=1 Tax=Tenacibaculum caenipelagi TaxID=1325435 RepID=A0A4R6TI21_9FLAO|nr:hypothetical protein [Tenacibaculum caenipelagi]TDQ29741.1 hypothetical protein DFQ07_0061 [Tenacibaculum caenipelagi]